MTGRGQAALTARRRAGVTTLPIRGGMQPLEAPSLLDHSNGGRSGGSGSSLQWVGTSPLMPLYGVSQPACQPVALAQKAPAQVTAITSSCRRVGWPAPIGR